MSFEIVNEDEYVGDNLHSLPMDTSPINQAQFNSFKDIFKKDTTGTVMKILKTVIIIVLIAGVIFLPLVSKYLSTLSYGIFSSSVSRFLLQLVIFAIIVFIVLSSM